MIFIFFRLITIVISYISWLFQKKVKKVAEQKKRTPTVGSLSRPGVKVRKTPIVIYAIVSAEK